MADISPSPVAPQPVSDDGEISLLDLLETLAERFWLLVLGPLAVGIVALGGSFLIAPTFTAKTVLMPPQAQQSAAASLIQSLGALGGVAGAAAGIKNPNDQIVALLKSRTLSDRSLDRFELMGVYKAKLRQDAYAALAGRVRVSAGKDGLIAIEVDDNNPKRAAEIANAYVQELSLLMGNLAMTEAQQRRLFFEKQLKEARDKMARAEIALKSGGIEADIYKSSPQAAVTAVAQVQAQIAAQEVKLGAMRGYMTESASEFRQGLVELQVLRSQLAKLEATEKSTQSGSNGDYVTRYRDYKYYEIFVDLFAKQYEIARVDESREGVVIQIVDPAMEPEWKSKPKRAVMAIIAALASGFLLVLYVFVAKLMKNASQDPATAAKLQGIWASIRLRREPPHQARS